VALLTLSCSFQEMMEKEFQVSMMGELIFFLGIQVKQMKQGTFVHQAKYTKNLMKKFNMAELKPMSTPMSTTTLLDPNENGEATDQREYMSMIGSLLYLMAGHSVRHAPVCVHFQASPRSLHQIAVQRIFRYSTSSSLDLVGFLDADFASYGIDRKSTSSTCHFLRSSLVCWSSQK
jgi:hypothetical protein